MALEVEYTPYIAAEGASKNHGEPFSRHRAQASVRLNNSQSGSMTGPVEDNGIRLVGNSGSRPLFIPFSCRFK
jgi:hypothetical protein